MEITTFKKYRAKARRLANKYGKNRYRSFEEAMDEICKEMGGYSVETITLPNLNLEFWGDEVARYINVGDTYDLTIIYRTDLDRFYISNVGDEVLMIEKKYHRSVL